MKSEMGETAFTECSNKDMVYVEKYKKVYQDALTCDTKNLVYVKNTTGEFN